MKKIFLILVISFVALVSNAQIKTKLIGKLNSTLNVTTEFKDNAGAIAEVAKNKETYKWLDGGVFNFAKDGKFTFKTKAGKIEKGRYSADDTRVKLIFDAESLPELNAYSPKLDGEKITLPFGVGMTKVNIELKK